MSTDTNWKIARNEGVVRAFLKGWDDLNVDTCMAHVTDDIDISTKPGAIRARPMCARYRLDLRSGQTRRVQLQRFAPRPGHHRAHGSMGLGRKRPLQSNSRCAACFELTEAANLRRPSITTTHTGARTAVRARSYSASVNEPGRLPPPLTPEPVLKSDASSALGKRRQTS